MKRKWENLHLCDSLRQSHEMKTKAAVREQMSRLHVTMSLKSTAGC
jgi:hypothetical protein